MNEARRRGGTGQELEIVGSDIPVSKPALEFMKQNGFSVRV